MLCWMNSRPNKPVKGNDMNRYTGFQAILNAALGDYHSKGFRLTELDDHCLMLYYQDDLVDVLSQGGATIPAIHEACREHLESLSAS